MKMLCRHPKCTMHPRHLTEKECNNPYSVLEEFFEYAHLPDRRDMLWKWFESTVVGNFPKGLGLRERTEIVAQYDDLRKLIEAVYILYKSKQDELEIKP